MEEEKQDLKDEEKKEKYDGILETPEFLRELSTRAGFTLGDSKVFLNTMQEIFEDAIEQNVSIKLRGFMTLLIQDIKPFRGVNAFLSKKTGEKVYEDFPASKRLIFKAGINLRDILREPEKRKIQSNKNKDVVLESKKELENENE